MLQFSGKSTQLRKYFVSHPQNFKEIGRISLVKLSLNHSITGMDASSPLEIFPTAAMTEERKNTLWRVTPFSLVPIPTATAMLLIGSQRYHADCFFPLAETLILGGTISLSLVIMSAVAQAVVGWIFDEPYLTKGTKMLLRGLERLSQFLAFAQVHAIQSTCHIGS